MIKKTTSEEAIQERPEEVTDAERDAMDIVLHHCIVLLLKHFVKDKSLPALVNVTWPTLMRIGAYLKSTDNSGLVVRDEHGELVVPDPIDIDIKRSHHRSVSALFQNVAMDKMIDLSEKDGVYSISAVNRTHTAFRQVRHLNVDALKDSVASGEGPASPSQITRRAQLVVRELHKVPKNLKGILSALSGEKEHLSLSEIKEALMRQFKGDGLEHPIDRSSVLIPEDHSLHKLAMQIGGIPANVSTDAAQDVRKMEKTSIGFRIDEGEEEGEGRKRRGKRRGGEGEEGGEEGKEEIATGGKIVAGVWVPDKVAPFSPTTQVRSIDTVWRAPSSSLGSKKALTALANESRNAEVHDQSKRKNNKKKSHEQPAASVSGPVSIRKDVLMKGLVSKLLPSYSIQTSQDHMPRYFNGSPPQVDVSVVQVRGNKNMTHIVGLESYGIDLEELAKEFRQKFAASSTVGPYASNPRLTDVCIQGHLANEAVEFLVKTYSMPRTLLSISLKKE